VELDAIVRRCLAIGVDQRWATAGALRSALDHYVAMFDEDASPQDVARFVLRHCGDALEARRVVLRDRFARASQATEAGLTAMPDGQTVRVRDDAPTLPALAPLYPRRRPGRLLPALAGIAGVIASWTFDVLPSARADASPPRGARQGTCEYAVRTPGRPHAKAPAPAPAAPAAESRRPSKRGGAGAITVPERRPATETPAAPDAAASPASAATSDDGGFVTVDAYPWARVTIDNVVRGVTPMVHLPIASGLHVVVLESPERGRHVMTVEVRPGETIAERWQWE
jgi:hypothetical protein